MLGIKRQIYTLIWATMKCIKVRLRMERRMGKNSGNACLEIMSNLKIISEMNIAR